MSKLLQEIEVSEIWLGGGVSQNIYLRQTIRETVKKFENERQLKKETGINKNDDLKSLKISKNKKIIFRAPFTKRLCMDNAAMIGLVANFKFTRNEFVTNYDKLDRKPRWQIGTEILNLEK